MKKSVLVRWRRLLQFMAVGCMAAAVHWLGVVCLVSQWGWAPVVANVPAWLLAFTVSFAGHYRWTFADQGATLGRAAGRFFGVSAMGFAINELAYLVLLRWSGQRYDLALALVLLMVAGLTYLVSRHWAFLRSELG